MNSIHKVNLRHAFSTITDHWNPRIAGELNGQMVKIAKLKGEFDMHFHEHEDELFLVHKGILSIELEDQTIILHEGEFVVIPRGVKHKPIAHEEVELILFEPATTLNTGNVKSDKTRGELDRLDNLG